MLEVPKEHAGHVTRTIAGRCLLACVLLASASASWLGCDTRPASHDRDNARAAASDSAAAKSSANSAANSAAKAAANSAAKAATEATPEAEAKATAAAAAAAEVTAYNRDIKRICYASTLSGALDKPEAERAFTIADWLGRNIETERGRAFLATLARTTAADKPALLEQTAKWAGVVGCPLAQSWAGPGPEKDGAPNL